MPHRYLSTLTTPAVEAAQKQYGSYSAIQRMTSGWHTDGVLGEDEIGFIAERDSFYLGTVGETGWPYVQHRGGPPGFLKVLGVEDGASLLAWADFRGNRQYVSVGNLGASAKVSLFLMDYPHQQRLKILGEARSHDARTEEAASLLEKVALPGYRAHVERIITVRVRGYDWNCPQHITPRWTEAELAPILNAAGHHPDDRRPR
ncbi:MULTISPECIES: pyridoxamine 5'-phosphate oxidase family protein [Amycolatopsis]|uniref:Pyridoxamine 5'-phosphate oxidase family protein n=1 Tax=Amycolatopsis tucumanensis TaxID=401106 RepID=A0ABP7HP04_9PSEU|nr:pyridoxamine 5'-phosphate oxidase family protein [Amycolatopsis tucumanensis]MCF6421343.1 pyridoxamine 5'-phosphate oxidase family protein [Amycolatopsis tucumanensis]